MVVLESECAKQRHCSACVVGGWRWMGSTGTMDGQYWAGGGRGAGSRCSRRGGGDEDGAEAALSVLLSLWGMCKRTKRVLGGAREGGASREAAHGVRAGRRAPRRAPVARTPRG